MCVRQVLNVNRLSKSAWVKIAHHFGRSGSSSTSGIKLKYRTLKEQAGDNAAGHVAANAVTPGMPQTGALVHYTFIDSHEQYNKGYLC